MATKDIVVDSTTHEGAAEPTVIKHDTWFANWVPPLILGRGGDDDVTITFECSNYVTLVWQASVRDKGHQDLAKGDGDTAYNRPQVFRFSPKALPTAIFVTWNLKANYPGDEGRSFFARVTVTQHDFQWVSERTYEMPVNQHILVLTKSPEFVAIGVPL